MSGKERPSSLRMRLERKLKMYGRKPRLVPILVVGAVVVVAAAGLYLGFRGGPQAEPVVGPGEKRTPLPGIGSSGPHVNEPQWGAGKYYAPPWKERPDAYKFLDGYWCFATCEAMILFQENILAFGFLLPDKK